MVELAERFLACLYRDLLCLYDNSLFWFCKGGYFVAAIDCATVCEGVCALVSRFGL